MYVHLDLLFPTLNSPLATNVPNLNEHNKKGKTKCSIVGVYPKPPIMDLYLDICNVKSLRSYELKADKLEVGANMPLTNAMELFYETATKPNFSYLEKVANHIDLIANVPVRNVRV